MLRRPASVELCEVGGLGWFSRGARRDLGYRWHGWVWAEGRELHVVLPGNRQGPDRAAAELARVLVERLAGLSGGLRRSLALAGAGASAGAGGGPGDLSAAEWAHVVAVTLSPAGRHSGATVRFAIPESPRRCWDVQVDQDLRPVGAVSVR